MYSEPNKIEKKKEKCYDNLLNKVLRENTYLRVQTKPTHTTNKGRNLLVPDLFYSNKQYHPFLFDVFLCYLKWLSLTQYIYSLVDVQFFTSRY